MGPDAESGSVEDMDSSLLLPGEDDAGGGLQKETIIPVVDLEAEEGDGDSGDELNAETGTMNDTNKVYPCAVYASEFAGQVFRGRPKKIVQLDVEDRDQQVPDSGLPPTISNEENVTREEGQDQDGEGHNSRESSPLPEKSDENRNVLKQQSASTESESLDHSDGEEDQPKKEKARLLNAYPFIEFPFEEPGSSRICKGFGFNTEPGLDDIQEALFGLIERKSDYLWKIMMEGMEAQKKAVDLAVKERNGVLKIPNGIGLKAYLVAKRMHKPPPARAEKQEVSVKKKAKVIHTPTRKTPSPRKELVQSPQLQKAEEDSEEMNASPSTDKPSQKRIRSSSSRKSIQPPKRYSEDQVVLLEDDPSTKRTAKKSKLRPNTFEMGMLPPKYPKQAEHSPSSSSARRSRTKESQMEPDSEEDKVEVMSHVEVEQQNKKSTNALEEVEGDSLFQISALFQSPDFQLQMMRSQHQQQQLELQQQQQQELEDYVDARSAIIRQFNDDGDEDDDVEIGYDSAPETDEVIPIQCNKCLGIFQIEGLDNAKHWDWMDYKCPECIDTEADRPVPELMPLPQSKINRSNCQTSGTSRLYGLDGLMQSHFQSRAYPKDSNPERLVMPPPPPPSTWTSPKSRSPRPFFFQQGHKKRHSLVENELGVRLPANTTLTKVHKTPTQKPATSQFDMNRLRGQLEKQGCSVLAGLLAPIMKNGKGQGNTNNFEVPKFPLELPRLPLMNTYGTSSSFSFPTNQANGSPKLKLPKLKKTAAKTTTILDTPKITLVPKSRSSKRKHAPMVVVIPEKIPNDGSGSGTNPNPSLRRIEIPALSGETFSSATPVQPQLFPSKGNQPLLRLQPRPRHSTPFQDNASVAKMRVQIPIRRYKPVPNNIGQQLKPWEEVRLKSIRPHSAPTNFPGNMSIARLRQQLHNPSLNMLPKRGRPPGSGRGSNNNASVNHSNHSSSNQQQHNEMIMRMNNMLESMGTGSRSVAESHRPRTSASAPASPHFIMRGNSPVVGSQDNNASVQSVLDRYVNDSIPIGGNGDVIIPFRYNP